jgi:transcriptional regulator with XRE-family HTH domain
MRGDYNNLGNWLPPLLKKAGLTPEQLSQRIGASRTTVYNWLSDKCRPGEETMARACRELKVPLEEGLGQYTPRPRGNPYFGPNNPWTTGLKQRKK